MARGVYVRTEEHIRKWLDSRKEYRHSQETKKKISEANKGRIFTEEHKKKISENHANMKGINNPNYGKKLYGDNNPHWKGGKWYNGVGYIMVKVRGRKPERIFEHRIIMEESLGRYLEPAEVVHHINGIRDDNRIENLMLFTNNTEHHKYHGHLE